MGGVVAIGKKEQRSGSAFTSSRVLIHVDILAVILVVRSDHYNDINYQDCYFEFNSMH